MLRIQSVLAVAICSVAALAATRPAPPTPAPAKLTVTGTLQTGIVAIGGETTGITITPADGRGMELDIRDAAMKRKAEELSGKQVTVTGTLTIRQGVETGQRRILMVDTLVAAGPPATAPAR